MEEQQNSNSAVTTFNDQTICDLLTTFYTNTYYNSPDNESNPHLTAVISLMERDYKVVKISNENKCFQYPGVIPIMESAHHFPIIYEDDEHITRPMNVEELEKLFESAKLARCRQRFPVPVILFRGNHVCRSATIASRAEVCYRGGLGQSSVEIMTAVKEFLWPSEELSPEEPAEGADNLETKIPPFCDNIRNEDVRLLKMLKVSNIVDIMVEKRKVKHGLYVSASEKVDRERYSSFQLICLPYPGCEFFTEFSDKLYNPDGLRYDFSPCSNDAELSVPDDHINKTLGIEWEEYKAWDLVPMTQNYLKLILKHLQEDNGGLLLHCISGWDRTPLFISLIRMSLWADGLVHESLNEAEMVYLTLAYDWYLFSHHLSDRLAKNEEIMVFCFQFLKYIYGEEFSIKSVRKRLYDEKIDEPRSQSRTSNVSIESDVDPTFTSDNDRKTTAPSFSELHINEDSEDILVIDEDTTMDNDIEEDQGNLVEKEVEKEDSSDTLLSPTKMMARKASAVPIGSPSKRQRHASTGSWQYIDESGSVENDTCVKSVRQQKLESAKTIFMSCYQKTVKRESYGPRPKSVVEDIVRYLKSFLETRKPTDPENGSRSGENGGEKHTNGKETQENGAVTETNADEQEKNGDEQEKNGDEQEKNGDDKESNGQESDSEDHGNGAVEQQNEGLPDTDRDQDDFVIID